MAPSAPTTVIAAWAGPFDAETPFGTIEPGAEVEIPYEQACSGHWVNPQTGEPFEPLPSSEPVETTEAAGEPAGEDTPPDAGDTPPGDAFPQGETHTATDDAGVSTGEEPI